MKYIAWYHPFIKTCLERYPHLKNQFEKKKNYILQNPLHLGEPLKGNLSGLRSFPIQRNFIIIFIICEECRRLKHEEINGCLKCGEIPDNSVIFLLFGPHDASYKNVPHFRRCSNRYDIFT